MKKLEQETEDLYVHINASISKFENKVERLAEMMREMTRKK